MLTTIYLKSDNLSYIPTASINLIESSHQSIKTSTNVTESIDEPSSYSGDLIIGSYVKISGTEGAGLRLRLQPGIDNQILFIAMEDEVLEVLDGPIFADEYYWWYVRAPYDKSRSGWAVADYLSIIHEK